ncbi:MAG: UDP-N-acetylmuramate dehydrogenase, partial [Clostridia bacterium]|nr:UDP-N-acetylmuramate dehydrogenase [Clostridia bacterium]
EPMCEHTSFKIGGNADLFIKPENTNELIFSLKSAKKHSVPVFILGKGSNILVSDLGIEGAVISLLKMDAVTVNGDMIVSECGANLSSVCIKAQQNGLSGLEFAYGIPGSIGGALYMNAGAYDGEMSQVVEGAYCLDEDLNEVYIEKGKMELSYRHSIFQKKMIITRVVFRLKEGQSRDISAKMDELLQRRKSKQPLEFPSAGSTFKRPVGGYAGTLIEKNGLKGAKCGGAMVSDKHAGFIINFDNATANDVENLINKVRETVKAGDGITLEPEVIFVGRR